MNTKANESASKLTFITVKYVEGWADNEYGKEVLIKVPFCRTYTITNILNSDDHKLRSNIFEMLESRVHMQIEPLLGRLKNVVAVAFHETGDAMSGEWVCRGGNSVFIETLKGKRNRKVDADSEE